MPDQGPVDLDAIAQQVAASGAPAAQPRDRADQGAIFLVEDKLIVLPDERADGAPPRDVHDTRWVIQVQGRLLNASSKVKTTLVVPCSSKMVSRGSDFVIPQSETDFSAKQVVA